MTLRVVHILFELIDVCVRLILNVIRSVKVGLYLFHKLLIIKEHRRSRGYGSLHQPYFIEVWDGFKDVLDVLPRLGYEVFTAVPVS